MHSFWKREPGRNDLVHWSNQFSGSVEAGRLTVRAGMNPALTVRLGDLEYAHDGIDKAVRPIGQTLFVQEPFVLAPQEIASDVGLRLIVGVLAQEDGIIMDARLETIAPVDRVSLSLSVLLDDSSAGSLCPSTAGWPQESLVVDGPEARWMEFRHGNEIVGAVAADLGEAGFVVGQRDGKRWEVTFFEQSLEKGVILVGRWGLLARPPAVSASAFRQQATAFFSRPTFL
jgi:hypothetical protein